MAEDRAGATTDPAVPSDTRPPATWRDYVAMARPDHWLKHVFILPGVALAYITHPTEPGPALLHVAIGLVSACLAASANYVINEWLDADSDRHHPSKSTRPAVARRVSPALIVVEYVALAAGALALAKAIAPLFVYCTLAFLASGLFYNVRPFRTKDRAYLDVVTEAVNNPIRLTLGWAMVWPETMPPSSLLLAYWMGGAFLMAIKRLAEYRVARQAGTLEHLRLYRRSFGSYDDIRLLISSFLYAQLAAFFLAVFLVKYRIEYLLALPVVALLFAAYLHVGLKPDSTAQRPEKLFKERLLVGVVVLLVAILALLTWIDLPVLDRLSDPHFLRLD